MLIRNLFIFLYISSACVSTYANEPKNASKVTKSSKKVHKKSHHHTNKDHVDADTVYVYYDNNIISDATLYPLMYTLRTNLKNNIHLVDTKNLKKGQWATKSKLLVIPGVIAGGMGLMYPSELGTEGRDIIQNYVKNGGNLFVICAGAYYASTEVTFNVMNNVYNSKPSDMRFTVNTKTESMLGMFPGVAVGPVLGTQYTDGNVRNFAMTLSNGIITHYTGGPVLLNAATYPDVTVLANYIAPDKTEAAILAVVKYGKGKVLVSGTHIETDPLMLQKGDAVLDQVSLELAKTNKARIKFVRSLLSEQFGLKLTNSKCKDKDKKRTLS